jgi:hypothetical protein
MFSDLTTGCHVHVAGSRAAPGGTKETTCSRTVIRMYNNIGRTRAPPYGSVPGKQFISKDVSENILHYNVVAAPLYLEQASGPYISPTTDWIAHVFLFIHTHTHTHTHTHIYIRMMYSLKVCNRKCAYIYTHTYTHLRRVIISFYSLFCFRSFVPSFFLSSHYYYHIGIFYFIFLYIFYYFLLYSIYIISVTAAMHTHRRVSVYEIRHGHDDIFTPAFHDQAFFSPYIFFLRFLCCVRTCACACVCVIFFF